MASSRFLDGAAQEESSEIGASSSRWFSLAVCSGVAALQGGYWATFGPISAAVKPFFGWTDADIALLANWGPIMFLICVVPLTWLMDTKGVKMACLLSASLLFLGSLCRIIHVTGDPTSGGLMHAGQVLNAMPGPVAMGIGPLVSATWFPPNERTTATAICAVANYGGTAMMFVLGPLVVRQDSNVEARLQLYMSGQCAVAALLLLGSCCMPSKPPFPPSASARITRTTMLCGLTALWKQPTFLAIAMSYGITSGFLGAWGSMLGPNMEDVLPSDIAEDAAGWMGFWGALAGVAVGVGLGLLSDSARLSGRKKSLVLAACTSGSLSYFLFACFCSRFFGTSDLGRFLAELYVTSICAALCCNAVIPLFFEMAVETAYPVAEGLATNFLTVVSNVASLVFLGLQCVPDIGTQWMNWACAGACFLPIFLILPFRELQHRLDFDQTQGAVAETGCAAGRRCE